MYILYLFCINFSRDIDLRYFIHFHFSEQESVGSSK